MTQVAVSSASSFTHTVPDVDRRVIEIVARSLDRSPDTVHLNSRLWSDLDAESLDMLDIVYGLERTFSIRMPRLNLLHRASELFGEETIVHAGVVTETGMELMRRSMPEIPGDWIKPGMKVYDFRRLITVESLARVVHRCLEATALLRCPACGGEAGPDPDSTVELRCLVCGGVMVLPSGEQLLVNELLRAGEGMCLERVADPA